MNEPSELTAEFWDAAAEGRLVRPVCAACGRSFFTPRVVCPHCRAAAWSYQDSDGLGTVSSHTTVYRGPDETWETPYVLGVVDVDEGWNLLTRLLVEPPDEAEPGALIGTRVRVQVSRVDLDGRKIDFRLVRDGDPAALVSRGRKGGKGEQRRGSERPSFPVQEQPELAAHATPVDELEALRAEDRDVKASTKRKGKPGGKGAAVKAGAAKAPSAKSGRSRVASRKTPGSGRKRASSSAARRPAGAR